MSQFTKLLTIGVAFVSTVAAAQTTRPQTPMSTTAASGSAASSEGQYRQSSSASGTTVNNSNSTNYNSNNVTNAPTGVGSNPSVSTDPTTLNGASSSSSPASSSSNAGSSSTSATNQVNKTGTSAAVTGAQTAPTPAIVAGSTTRNSSIHDYIASSPNYTTLQNALQTAQLDNSLKEGGPYTLFAPSNSAFKKLPASMQAGLLEGRNQDKLKQLLAYHLVEGQLDEEELTKRIKANSGKAQLRTVSGGSLLVQMNAKGQLTLTAENGQTAMIDSANKRQSNGIVHGIDTVLIPKNGAATIR